MGWIDGFLENRGWAGIVQRNATTGLLESGGTAITGIASYTYAQFAAFTAGEKAALAGIPIHINDLHQSSDGIGGSYVVRDASPAGWAQISGPMYYATFDLVPAAGSYPGWRYRVGSGIGIGGADIYDTGTRLRYVNGSAIIKCIYADVLHTTDFSVEKIAASVALPRNTGKNIMQDGDTLDIRAVIGRTAVVTNITRNLRFGTASSGIGNTLIETLNVSTNATLGEFLTIMRRDSTNLFVLGGATASKWSGTSTGGYTAADDPVTSIDSATMYLDYGILQSANTDEGVALEALIITLNHSGA